MVPLFNDASAENTLRSQHKRQTAASHFARSVPRTLATKSLSRKRESKPPAREPEYTVQDFDGGPDQAIPRAARTIDSFRDFLLTFRYSNRSLDEKHVATIGERCRHGVRRGRSWLISRPLIFNHLEDQLKAAMERSYLEHRDFLPRGKLYQLVTRRSVDKEVARQKYHSNGFQKRFHTQRGPISIPLEESKPPQRLSHSRSRSAPELSKHPSGGTYRMIFAILVFIRQPLGIWSFIEEGVCDADLPLEEKHPRENGNSRLDLRSKRNPYAPVQCFQNWENGAIKDFAEHQWAVLAPVFEKSEEECVPHLKLHPKHILPFTWKPLERGGFGQVYKTSIHPDHHNFDRALVYRPKEPLYKRLTDIGKTHQHYDVVAVKELLPRKEGAAKTKEAFEAESRILRNISSVDHTNQHLITLLASYEQQGRYFLIFPWAERDLEQYWEDTIPEPGMAKWMIDQCQGLANGLSHVHHYPTMPNTTMVFESSLSEQTSIASHAPSSSLTLYGRHGDIKPKNILWFRDPCNNGYGTLKITDFGIAQFTSDNTESARRKGIVPNSYTYRSPECDFPDAEISPQCDIWALGCVYLVFITWYLGGWNYVQNFASRRKARDRYWHHKVTSDTFFTITEDGSGMRVAKVKDSVVLVSLHLPLQSILN